jgi:7-carboxy-7-deazaguanine synthase
MKLAQQGVYASIQGEGAMAGVPMVFIRLAGCSIGCPQCDTDYRADRSREAKSVADEAASHGLEWAWITGGEPTDHALGPLVERLRSARLKVAIATAGMRAVAAGLADWLSVSPHKPGKPAQWSGHEVKLVFGLNGLSPGQCDPRDYLSFPYRYAMPCDGVPESADMAREWVLRHPGWRLGYQAHKAWGVA